MLSSELWWEVSKEHSYFLGVIFQCPEVKLSNVKHEVIDGGLGEWRGVGTMDTSMSLIARGL